MVAMTAPRRRSKLKPTLMEAMLTPVLMCIAVKLISDSDLYFDDGNFETLESQQDAIRWQVENLPESVRNLQPMSNSLLQILLLLYWQHRAS